MKHLTIIDGNSIMFRAYFATAYPGATLMQTTTGIYTNAVFAFVNMFERLKDLSNDHILVCFDTPEKNFRHEKFTDYKATRNEAPEELLSQIPLIYELLDKQGIKYFSQAGYEADDLIGIMANKATKAGIKVDIYSSDRDLLQLVSDNVTVNLLKKGMKELLSYTPQKLYEEYELSPPQIIDLKALMGDSSDNIPGIKGIGEKTALKLLKDYQSLNNILLNADKNTPSLATKLKEGQHLAHISYELATIVTEADINLSLDDTLVKNTNHEELLKFYQKLELKQIAINFQKKHQLTTKTQPTTQLDGLDLFSFDENPSSVTPNIAPKTDFNYTIIQNVLELKNILQQDLSIYFEFDKPNYHKAHLWGIGLSNGEHSYFVDPLIAFSDNEFINYLKSDYKKLMYDYKSVMVYLLWQDIKLNNVVFDLQLAAYVLNPSFTKDDFIHTVLHYERVIKYDEEVYGSGTKKALPLLMEDYAHHIAKKAFLIFDLKDELIKKLESCQQLALLNDVEIPLSKVLAKMEFKGISVDQTELETQTKNMHLRIKDLEEQIFQIANQRFNVASTKQLAEVLIGLGLSLGKKTKTGYSTDNEVLNMLVDQHEIIPLVIQYRALTKLYSTYLVGLKEVMFANNKIHTIYKQALTLTGRLSSVEPNLQNIPIRTLEGSLIRKIFVADADYLFLGADYSQIELRVLADIADEANLIESFKQNEDIHESTARKIFDVTTVNAEQRRRAKAVNFGIIYGIGPYSLGNDIGVSYPEAQNFIDTYLSVYPNISKYMQDIKQFVLKNGYVATILNRRRYIPEVQSLNKNIREFGFRTALNAPIQGSAADIIKIAMINLDRYIGENKLKSKLILQVHDELIIAVYQSEIEIMKEKVTQIMQDAYTLKVKLETSCSIGKTWFELKD